MERLPYERRITNNLEDRPAQIVAARSEKLLESSVHKSDAPLPIDQEQAILERGKNGVCARNTFRNLLIEPGLTIKKLLEVEPDLARTGGAVQQKGGRLFSPGDAPDHLFDPLPRRDPFPPDMAEQNNQSDDRAEEEPAHSALPIGKAIAKAAHRFDGVARLAQFVAQPAHVRVHRSRIDHAFITPHIVEQSIARLHAPASLQ